MNSTLQEATGVNNDLKRKIQISVESVRESPFSLTRDQFSNSFKILTENFYKSIASFEEEDEMNLFCYNYLSNFVLNISHTFLAQTENMQAEVADTFSFFTKNFIETNQNLLNNSNEMIRNLQAARENLFKKQEEYFKVSKNAERAQETLELIMKNVNSPVITNAQLVTATNGATAGKKQAKDALMEYEQQLSILNQKWDIFDSEFLMIFDNFDMNEESKTSFIKITVNLIMKSLTQFFSSFFEATQDYNPESYDNKIKEIEEKKLFDRNNHGNTLRKIIKGKDISLFDHVKREEFIPYDEWKKSNKEKSGGEKSKDKTLKENKAAGKSALKSKPQIEANPLVPQTIIIDDKTLFDLVCRYLSVKEGIINDTSPNGSHASVIDYQFIDMNLGQLFKEIEIRKTEGTYFDKFSCRKYFLNKIHAICNLEQSPMMLDEKIFSLFVEMGNKLVSRLADSEEKDADTFHKLILFLVRFFTIKKDSLGVEKKSKLISEIQYNRVWESKVKWDLLFGYFCQRETMNVIENYSKFKKFDKEKESNITKSLMKISKKFEENFRNLEVPSAMDFEMQESRDRRSLVINNKILNANALEQVNNLLMEMNLSMDKALEVIIFLAKKYKLRDSVLNNIIDLQEKKWAQLSDDKNWSWKQYRKEHTLKKSIKWGPIYAVSLAVDYIADKSSLLNLLLLNKYWSKNLKNLVYKSLLVTREQVSTIKRINLWILILEPNSLQFDYAEMKQKCSLSHNKDSHIEDLIKLDVQRSFHNHTNINHMVLYNLLRMYAFYDRNVSYCQGMNFIMGFMFNYLQSEELTFRCFCKLIEKFLKNLLSEDLSAIRINFFIIDRLISLYIPELSEHLNVKKISFIINLLHKFFHFPKREKIDSSLFASSWLLTVFTNSFQHTNFSFTLMNIWDIILLENWKGFYKATILIMKTFKEKLLGMKFDKILSFLNDIVKSEIFTNKEYKNDPVASDGKKPDSDMNQIIDNFKANLIKINVPKSLLSYLEKEYFIMKSTSKDVYKTFEQK